MFLNFLNKNKIHIFFKPNSRKKFDILKAPYRFKMSKNQLYFSRFDVLISFLFFSKISIHNNNLLYLYTNLLNFFHNFEVNICIQNCIKIFFKFNYANNFLV